MCNYPVGKAYIKRLREVVQFVLGHLAVIVTLLLSWKKNSVTRMSLPINLTKSTLIVLNKLTSEGPMYPAEIAKKSGLAMRTVTLALKTLQSGHLCRKVPNLLDMRKPMYHIDQEKVSELQRNMEIWRSMANLHLPR